MGLRKEHAVGPLGLDLIPQGQLSAARGRMVCAPPYGARKEHAVRLPRLGLLRRGGYQLPAGA